MKTVADKPWLTPGAIEFLETVINEESVVVETGAGGSTIWLAARVAKVTTYEHNPLWARLVRRELVRRRLSNVRLVLDPEYPATGLGHHPARSVDLLLVDGRGRCLSIRTGLPAVRPRGWVFLDNSERERYAPIVKELDERFTTRVKFVDGWEARAWRV
jgi:predicted O-methyltransferase YrrM